MLKAIIHNKNPRFYERYLPGRRGLQEGEKRRTQEDEITSMMIGPLAYQPAPVVWNVFVSWLKIASNQAIPTGVSIDSVQFNFWQKEIVEPDVLVYFESDNKRWTFLIEAKWHSGQSGGDQFEKQRNLHCKNEDQFFHIALLKHKDDPIKTNVPLHKLHKTTYAEYIAAVGTVPLLATLANDLQQLADKLQLNRHFTGFAGLGERQEIYSKTMTFFRP